MALKQARDILRQANGENIEPAVVLAQLLAVFCRERLQPLDPDYVSAPACRVLLDHHPEIQSLLEVAIKEQNYEGLWTCNLLSFDGTELRSRRAQSKGEAAWETGIQTFVKKHGAALRDYAVGDKGYALWAPPKARNGSEGEAAPHTAFIASLRIPNAGDRRPSLLFHRLGNLLDSEPLTRRLKSIFRAGQHTLFVNGAATGKTRLLLEGLSRRWGLYFACNIEPSKPGSTDLFNSLDYFRHPLRSAAYPDTSASMETILKQVAADVSGQIMLARLTIFKLYLESLSDPHDIRHRQRWLILQSSPIAMVQYDLFIHLIQYFDVCDVAQDYIQRQIADTLLGIRSIIGRDEPLFCVVDDAQSVSNHRVDADMGSTTILREITRHWETLEGLTLILSGTPFDMAPFQLSGGPRYHLFTDTGFFDDPEEQATYVRRYMPLDLAESESGKKLVWRICLWLRGRYCATTCLLECMLATCFSHPHTLLDAYIALYTGIEPADGPVRVNSRVRQRYNSEVHRFGLFDPFIALSRDGQGWYAAQMAVLRIVTLGQERVRITEDTAHLADRGFAVFSDSHGAEAIIGEPVHIFPIVKLFYQRWGPTFGLLHTRLASGLRAQLIHPSFHLAIIPLLLLAFKGGIKLSDLFGFAVAPPAWANQTCRLVCVTRDMAGQSRATPYSSSFPAHEVTFEPWATESPSWLQHTAPEPFCVASGFSHADLLFVLQLADGVLIHVAVKIMLKNEHVGASSGEIGDSLAQMRRECIFQTGGMEGGGELRLADLPSAGAAAASPSMLRAFATFPQPTDVSSVSRDDTTMEPIASLNLQLLQELSETVPYESILRRVFLTIITKRRRRWLGDTAVLRVMSE
ncbi:hypothetical protein BD626DRAFT_565707 [Schizophyllum amplum]|uniref:Uncharacterized protein n=1 Tax=Schizophyllum amplum TaxID=97359 RepID=A0A550CPD4_9AGAR|nr:hypothetical protein BD626DRAFT_565707 [Auriculariopsis ampla]